MSTTPTLNTHLNPRAAKILDDARQQSEAVLVRVRDTADPFMTSKKVASGDVCLVVVGSVGREEALAASDVDLIPVLGSQAALSKFNKQDKALRAAVAAAVGM